MEYSILGKMLPQRLSTCTHANQNSNTVTKWQKTIMTMQEQFLFLNLHNTFSLLAVSMSNSFVLISGIRTSERGK